MYKRKEKIVDENLEWDQNSELLKQVKIALPSGIKPKKSFQHKQIGLSEKFTVKKNVTGLFSENVTLLSIAGILIVPYILGFVITFFLYSFYGGMTIAGFFTIDKDYLPLQLWSIGAYLFITAWVIWAVLNTFKGDR